MDKPRISDEELVKKCQAELPFITYSFEILVNRYKHEVFEKALFFVQNRQDAEDLSQEIFLKIFDALPKFEMRASFRTWLFAITKNTCLTFIERRKNRRWWWMTVDIDEIKESEREDKSMFILVTNGLEREDLRKKINTVMNQLGPVSKEALELRYYQELDFLRIADTLKIKLSTAKMRVKRAREEFRQLFTKMEKEER